MVSMFFGNFPAISKLLKKQHLKEYASLVTLINVIKVWFHSNHRENFLELNMLAYRDT